MEMDASLQPLRRRLRQQRRAETSAADRRQHGEAAGAANPLTTDQGCARKKLTVSLECPPLVMPLSQSSTNDNPAADVLSLFARTGTPRQGREGEHFAESPAGSTRPTVRFRGLRLLRTVQGRQRQSRRFPAS